MLTMLLPTLYDKSEDIYINICIVEISVIKVCEFDAK